MQQLIEVLELTPLLLKDLISEDMAIHSNQHSEQMTLESLTTELSVLLTTQLLISIKQIPSLVLKIRIRLPQFFWAKADYQTWLRVSETPVQLLIRLKVTQQLDTHLHKAVLLTMWQLLRRPKIRFFQIFCFHS